MRILLLIPLILCSCKTTKDIQKTKTDTKTETVVNTVTTETITETAVEDVKIKEDSLVIKDIPIQFDNDSIVAEDENLKLVITKDKKTGKAKAKITRKEKIVPVNINRVTARHTNEKKKIKSREITKQKDKDVERTGPSFNLNYLWWLLLLLLIPLYRYRHKLLG
jgi:hypothetical protein